MSHSMLLRVSRKPLNGISRISYFLNISSFTRLNSFVSYFKIFLSVKTKVWRLITPIILTIVTTMLTVPIPRDHFTARVIMATQETVLFVQVKINKISTEGESGYVQYSYVHFIILSFFANITSVSSVLFFVYVL